MQFVSVLASMVFLTSAAMAAEPATGSFTASRGCDAYQSFRKGTNPGSVRVEPGAEYEIREVNDRQQNWLRLEIPGVSEPLRWVAAECGVAKGLQLGAAPGNAPAVAAGQCTRQPGAHDSYVLAVSWQPGFCEHVKYSGTKPECDHMAAGRLVVSNLTLHGLWPNVAACGTKYGSCGDSEPALSEDTISYISPWMPNFFYERAFGSYEWKKHGTCSAMDSNGYFRRAVDAVKTLQNSAVGQYITANIGGRISKKQLYAALQQETGRSMSEANVTLLCTNKQLFEVRVRLPLDFREGASLNDLLGPDRTPSSSKDSKECQGDEILIEASGP